MSNTTILTMFFNLKKLKDASLQTRPHEFYIENGRETLKLKYPMVIFCDKDSYDFLKKIRNEEVDSTLIKTEYIIKNITEYDYYQHNWDIIHENRKRSLGYRNPDDRNTVSYFLMGMFKPLAFLIAKQKNFFNTTHYAWIDLGCNHIVRKLAEFAPKMLDSPKSKISACYIHYRSENEIISMKKYIESGGPCGIASTAYTVEGEYIDRYYTSMFSIFNEMLFSGYGHTDETVMVYSYTRHPELYTIYYGNYYSIFTNYHNVTEDYYSIKKFFIVSSINKNRRDLAKECSAQIIRSYQQKLIELNQYEINFLTNI
jgi:hypothetical protein